MIVEKTMHAILHLLAEGGWSGDAGAELESL
jgi:hypothetical protein